MNYDFLQILIIVLILLLFGRDYVPALLKKFFNIETNGKNGNGKHVEIDTLKNQIDVLQDNHIHTLGEKIDKLTERMIEHNALEIALLNDIKEVLKK